MEETWRVHKGIREETLKKIFIRALLCDRLVSCIKVIFMKLFNEMWERSYG